MTEGAWPGRQRSHRAEAGNRKCIGWWVTARLCYWHALWLWAPLIIEKAKYSSCGGIAGQRQTEQEGPDTGSCMIKLQGIEYQTEPKPPSLPPPPSGQYANQTAAMNLLPSPSCQKVQAVIIQAGCNSSPQHRKEMPRLHELFTFCIRRHAEKSFWKGAVCNLFCFCHLRFTFLPCRAWHNACSCWKHFFTCLFDI